MVTCRVLVEVKRAGEEGVPGQEKRWEHGGGAGRGLVEGGERLATPADARQGKGTGTAHLRKSILVVGVTSRWLGSAANVWHGLNLSYRIPAGAVRTFKVTFNVTLDGLPTGTCNQLPRRAPAALSCTHPTLVVPYVPQHQQRWLP
ncbi:hypothetical protein E2C01_010968 [Portunus trituberculatus]|uniref:Uncharacterized protein n=1 Tax=Portunus trituberculatus TaxID=210409 RepID=A0A5B7D9S4_PORTR|nr:hypothetical protein [Portunus trituberculatus]